MCRAQRSQLAASQRIDGRRVYGLDLPSAKTSDLAQGQCPGADAIKPCYLRSSQRLQLACADSANERRSAQTIDLAGTERNKLLRAQRNIAYRNG